MSINNEESQTGPQLNPRAQVNLEIPRASLRKRLEALHPRKRGGISKKCG